MLRLGRDTKLNSARASKGHDPVRWARSSPFGHHALPVSRSVIINLLILMVPVRGFEPLTY